MTSNLHWRRRFPDSANNFDLVLENSDALDSEELNKLLGLIQSETHRGLTLSSRASNEFRRFFAQPDRGLPAVAFVLLSNWFMTQSGDRNSLVASHCEHLWDALFPCRPTERLSSPAAGQNHIVVPEAFEVFWRRVLKAQGDEQPESATVRLGAPPILRTQALPTHAVGVGEDDTPVVFDKRGQHGQHEAQAQTENASDNRLTAEFEKEGMHCKVEGSPQALAELLSLMSGWETK